TLADGVSSFTGPDGADLLGQLSGFEWLDDAHLRVDFAAQTAPGLYCMVIGPQILRASDHQPMDQDFDGVPGEMPDDQYAALVNLNDTGADAFGYRATVYPFTNRVLIPGDHGVFTVVDNLAEGYKKMDLGASGFTYYGTIYPSLWISPKGVIALG